MFISAYKQRWSSRGRPWPRGLKPSKIGLSSARRQHYFLNSLNFVERLKNFLEGDFFWRSPEKFLWRLSFLFYFLEHLRLCPWSLASNIPVLGLESVCPRKGCPWPWIFFVSLATSLVYATPPLFISQQWVLGQVFVALKELKKMQIFITKVAKSCIYSQTLKTTVIYSSNLFT